MGIMEKRSLVQTITKKLKASAEEKKKRGPKSTRVKLNICLIKRCFDQMRTEIVILQELKLDGEDVERFTRIFKGWRCMIVESIGGSGGLGILWKDTMVDIQMIRAERSWKWVEVWLKQSHFSFYLINVYGPNNIQELRFV